MGTHSQQVKVFFWSGGFQVKHSTRIFAVYKVSESPKYEIRSSREVTGYIASINISQRKLAKTEPRHKNRRISNIKKAQFLLVLATATFFSRV